jgi:hypothetical protein
MALYRLLAVLALIGPRRMLCLARTYFRDRLFRRRRRGQMIRRGGHSCRAAVPAAGRVRPPNPRPARIELPSDQNKLNYVRETGESYSDVILRLACE